MDRSNHSISPYDFDALAGVAKVIVSSKKCALSPAFLICGVTQWR